MAVLLLVLKSPDAIFTPQFWAEDGPIFFAAQYQYDWPKLLTPYAGYLHTVTRLIAWIANFFEVLYAPLIFNSLAILVDAVCVTYVSIRAGAWFPRWSVFVSFFIVPTTGEIFGTATNVQWFMQFAIAVACLMPVASSSVSSKMERVIGYLALSLAALSGPFSVLIAGIALCAKLTTFLPIAPRDTTGRSEFKNVLNSIRAAGKSLPTTNIFIVVVCAGIQALVLLTTNIRVAPELFLLSAAQFSSLGFPLLDSFYAYSLIMPFTPLFCVEALGIASVGAACLIFTARRPSALSGASCLLLLLGGIQPILAFIKVHEMHTLATSGRYCFMLIVVCCWVAAHILRSASPPLTKIGVVIVGIVVALGTLRSPDYFRRRPLHDLAWVTYANQIRVDGKFGVVVPVNPVPWHFKLKEK